MSTMTRTFRWVDDSQTKTGNSGWLPTWFDCESYDPSGGLGVAHDCLEHRFTDRGLWHQELMAFGAMIYARCLGGYFQQRVWSYDQDKQMVSLGDELADLFCQYPSLYLPTKVPKLRCRIPEDAAEWIDGIAAACVAEVLEAQEEDRYGTGIVTQKAYLERFKQWLEVGFDRAATRYAKASPYLLHETFALVEELVDRRFSPNSEWYGHKLTLKITPERVMVESKLVEPYDYYE